MIFWKIDDETIRCLINRDEISNMGYDLEVISEDADQMEAFLEAIVSSSREYIDWRTENGIQNYMARALPADQFLITISCTFQDELIDRNLDQIRRMTETLKARISEERLKKISALSGEEKEKAFAELSQDLYAVCNGDIPGNDSQGEHGADGDARSGDVSVIETPASKECGSSSGNSLVSGHTSEGENVLPDRKLIFKSLDNLITFASMLQKQTLFTSTLFKSAKEYVLLVQFDKCKRDSDALSFILTAEEYGGECSPVRYDRAYMLEHGRELLKDNALEVLASM